MRRPGFSPLPTLRSSSRRSTLTALGVLLLHAGLGYGLLHWQRALPTPPKAVVSLRLLPVPLKPPAQSPPQTAPNPKPKRALPAAIATLTPPAQSAGPTAITVSAAPQAAASAASSPASAPLNLALPKSWKPEVRLNPAQQAVHDPRANSPRYSAQEALARRMGNEAETLELAGGGSMTRRPDGSCTRTLPSRANALVPMDPHLQVGGSHSGGCFSDKPGSALQHARPR